jgi:hypothetical protein
MHTAVLKEINNTCECFSKEVLALKRYPVKTHFDILK